MKRAFRIVVLAAVLLGGCAREIDPVAGVPAARALLEQGKTGEARILLKNLVSRHPETAPARVLLARIALDEGNAQAANAELSVLNSAALADPEALQLRARVDIGIGEPEAALQRLQTSGAVVAQPDRALLMASAYRALGSSAEALAMLREVQATTGVSEPLVLGIAETLAMMGNTELAAAELDRYLAASPVKRADALHMRGEVKLRQGEPEEATSDFHAALAAAPANWPLISRITTELMVVDAQIAAGEIDAARVQLARVEKSWPGTLGAMVLQGQIALLEGRPEEAVQHLSAVVAAGAGNERIQYLLVEALMKSGNTARANELLERLVAAEAASSPTDTAARLLLADYHLLRGREDVAREHLEIIVKESPNELAALNNLAWVLRSSAPDRAESLAKRARAIAPDNSAVADTLGVILLANGKTDEAVEALAQAAAGLPGNRTVQYHYAWSLSKVGQKDKARGILGELLKSQQGFPDRVAAQRLFEELG